MNYSAVAYTAHADSAAAGQDLGEQFAAQLHGARPDALVVFASPRYEYSAFLTAIKQACNPAIMVGCSSAGEYVTDSHGEGAASAVAFRSDEMQFGAAVGKGLRADRTGAVENMIKQLRGVGGHEYRFRSALVMTDALAGHADELVESFNLLTAGRYQLFGGGAGDDANFSRTHVFFDTEALPDAAVALEILSNKPIGIGVSHGWQTASAPMRVTEADGMRLISLDATLATEVFEEFAARTKQTFDRADPLPFFLHNILGIDTGAGYKLRVPLAVNADGSVTCAANIATGSTVYIMSAKGTTMANTVARATAAALAQIQGHKPGVALFFDCVATRLRSGREFGFELNAVQQALGPARYVGCNTYGQIARSDGQFSGFHNCTAVVCVIPE